MDNLLRLVESPVVTVILTFCLIIAIAKIFGQERKELLAFLRHMAKAEISNPIGRVCLVGTTILGLMFTLALFVDEFREVVFRVLKAGKVEDIHSIFNVHVGLVSVAVVLILNFVVMHINTRRPRS